MIERNRNPAGRLYNVAFGVACLADGLIRILSGGFLHSRFPVEISKRQARNAIKRAYKARANQTTK